MDDLDWRRARTSNPREGRLSGVRFALPSVFYNVNFFGGIRDIQCHSLYNYTYKGKCTHNRTIVKRTEDLHDPLGGGVVSSRTGEYRIALY